MIYNSLFKNEKFLRLWTSQILSQLSINIINFLLLTKIFEITGSPIATSLLWVTYALPAIFVGPIGAALVDIVSLRKTLIITNFLQSVTIFGLYFVRNESLFIFYFIVLLYSFLNQFYVPAESAALPGIVDKKNLAKANSLFFITQQAALVAGFGFGGVIERMIGFSGAVLFAASILFIAAISVWLLPELPIFNKIPKNFAKAFHKFFNSIEEGYNFIKSNKGVLYPLFLLLVLQIFLAVIVANLPIIGSQILKVNANYSGFLVVVPAGIGAFLGSLYVPKKLNKSNRKMDIIKLGSFIGGLASVALAWLIPYVPFVLRILFSFILVGGVGFGYILASIPTLTYLQEVTPEEIRGRVFGNMWFMVTVLTLFPVLFSGFLTEVFGVKMLITLMGLICFAIYYYLVTSGRKVVKENF